MIDTLVFDLDGTLIDSLPTVQASLNRLLADKNRRLLSLDKLKTLIGHGVNPMIEGAYKITGEPVGSKEILDKAVEQYLLYYRQKPAERTVVYPNVIETLNELKSKGYIMGICTNKPYEISLLVLQALGIKSLFEGISGGDNYSFIKPDPRHILHTLKLMGSTPERALMVGDSHIDGEAGRKAGLTFILVNYGYKISENEHLKADQVINEFKMLPKAITDLSESQ